ncbi:hypothetical protein KEM60_02783 [Austwickia sp. TVS 96-490-7B]|uniref:DUF2017 family protein n=1 Tax=Austwickia sp. TVS 96-490-7B TaxID=2830843 RepID=UPI001C57D881|nr:DUF2017 family protein [Austwickia sp. TVS 96-490-7B]MBW3086556.1 hypothetical protein [Austwickia sp. TVS 96-490-7B]
MAYAFNREGDHYVGKLDPEERSLIISLFQQVHELVAPPTAAPEGGDEFEMMLRQAGLARLGDELDGMVSVPGSTEAAPLPAMPVPTSYDDLDDPERDPALDRLLPDGHRDDPLVAAEFRRMSAPGLRARKATVIATAIEALRDEKDPRVALDEEQARSVAVALTDVRLVVGERLGLRTDADGDRLERDLARGRLDAGTEWLMAVYDFLTWLQESLTSAMLEGLDEDTA